MTDPSGMGWFVMIIAPPSDKLPILPKLAPLSALMTMMTSGLSLRLARCFLLKVLSSGRIAKAQAVS